jgi:hypothetical protein
MRTPRAVSALAAGKVAALLSVLLMLPLVAGCARGPGARPWAASVCEALAPWRSEITALNSRAQQQMTAETTPAQAKENLVRLLSGAQAASDKARAGVSKAGVPDVSGGAAVAHGFMASLTAVRDAYGQAEESISKLGTGEAKGFYDGVSAVLTTLNKEYTASALDTGSLSSPELKRAFDEVPECR